jgi:hypothetical protein
MTEWSRAMPAGATRCGCVRPGPPVPGTLLGVAVLGYRDQLVEVEAVPALR